MTCVQQLLPLRLADVRACLSDGLLQSALSSVQPACLSPVRAGGCRQGEWRGMPRLFGKCQCAAAPAITEAASACVLKRAWSREGLIDMPSYCTSFCPRRLTSRRLDVRNHTHSFRQRSIGVQTFGRDSSSSGTLMTTCRNMKRLVWTKGKSLSCPIHNSLR